MDLNIYPKEFLGKGVDGEVWSLNEFQVVKYSNNICNKLVFDYLISNQPCAYARVYDYKLLDNSFYYVLEKLNNISEDEKRIFHTILSHEDSNKVKNFSKNELNSIIRVINSYLYFDADKVKLFYHSIFDTPINHNDLHIRNIMKTNDGYFKLVDFDRATLKEVL